MQNESVVRLNGVTAFSVAVSALAVVLRLLIPANDSVSLDDRFAATEVDSPEPFPQQTVQTQQFRVQRYALGNRIDNGQLVGRISENATVSEPQQVALRWEYTGARLGSEVECFFGQEGEPEISSGKFNIQYVDGNAWCFAQLSRPGRYTIRAMLDGTRIISTNLTVREPVATPAPAETIQPRATRSSNEARVAPSNRENADLSESARILCTVPGPNGAPPRDVRMTVAECEAAAGLVN